MIRAAIPLKMWMRKPPPKKPPTETPTRRHTDEPEESRRRDGPPTAVAAVKGIHNALIGIIIAGLVNIFLASSALQFAISALGVLIFAGLTAYDTQNIKNTYLQLANSDQDFLGKSAIMGALTLYLDFINLFLMLLRILGNRR